jgi:hypothetical protein
VIANKAWEVHPLLDALLNPRFQPDPTQPFLPDTTYTAWRSSQGAPIQPRGIFAFDHVHVEIWCIADHMDPGKSHSSSQEKNRILPAFFAYQPFEPSLVIAFGTGSARPDMTCNGSVFIGSRVFIHDGHPSDDPNPKSEWRSDAFDTLLESTVQNSLFDRFKEFKAAIERKMLAASVNVSTLGLHCNSNFVAVSTVNVTDFKEYAIKDRETILALANAGVTAPVGSVETTHGVIRVQSNAPFMFITGIPNRFGKFDDDMGGKPEAQNYVAGFNAGIAAAYLLPVLNAAYAIEEN